MKNYLGPIWNPDGLESSEIFDPIAKSCNKVFTELTPHLVQEFLDLRKLVLYDLQLQHSIYRAIRLYRDDQDHPERPAFEDVITDKRSLVLLIEEGKEHFVELVQVVYYSRSNLGSEHALLFPPRLEIRVAGKLIGEYFWGRSYDGTLSSPRSDRGVLAVDHWIHEWTEAMIEFLALPYVTDPDDALISIIEGRGS